MHADGGVDRRPGLGEVRISRSQCYYLTDPTRNSLPRKQEQVRAFLAACNLHEHQIRYVLQQWQHLDAERSRYKTTLPPAEQPVPDAPAVPAMSSSPVDEPALNPDPVPRLVSGRQTVLITAAPLVVGLVASSLLVLAGVCWYPTDVGWRDSAAAGIAGGCLAMAVLGIVRARQRSRDGRHLQAPQADDLHGR